MGKKQKQIGKGYEYRVRDYLRLKGYEAERNVLSGASKQIEQLIAKYDVRAKKNSIFFQIECKKTNVRNKIIIDYDDWIKKLDFFKDEFLCFSFSRSEHYVIVDINLFKRETFVTVESLIHYEKIKGKRYLTFKRKWIESYDAAIIDWEKQKRQFLILSLDKFLNLREENI